ncbi:MAG: FtsX-like permease family protein [Gemmatales bacterium]|nr:FtsX-like permease family protein [Gemmatales bacterium]MCS7160989.1 FtsX-like permease family protein [Gemmatales bacterium]MDW8176192.1 FtsX-like permease family protein [Gemmatales bacterium]MDW8223750.1 FtsX-like permease family protein [Gemmatales bacterium]
MYKWLLAWRYLRTRYLALASIISVMLGVATLIVVNSVMAGFASKLRDRLRGLLSDIIIEHRSDSGFWGVEHKVQQVYEILGDCVEAVSPAIETFGILQYSYPHSREVISRPVLVIGIEPGSRARAGQFAQYLYRAENRIQPERCFEVRGDIALRFGRVMEYWRLLQERRRGVKPGFPLSPLEPNFDSRLGRNPGELSSEHELPTPEPPQLPPELREPAGIILGYSIATYRRPDAHVSDAEKDIFLLRPGDRVTLMLLTAFDLPGHDGTQGLPRPMEDTFAITDLFRSEMSEYDARLVFIHLRDMQRLRGMTNRAKSLYVKLRDYERDAHEAIRLLSTSEAFPPHSFLVQTWEERQGSLLAAIAIERGILNVLLFLIIAVAGFGILAIFYTIVVEKTRDIGILKALGASHGGICGLFLGYGLFLGLVGAGLGTACGIGITVYINEIEQLLAKWTGQEVFNRSVYYFDQIPTDLQLGMVLSVNAGAILIAVLASVYPALRAALLHPARAVRWE